MSSTLFRYKNFRFFFFSREEQRMHIHVSSPDGEAKFWIEPIIALASSEGFRQTELKELHRIIEVHHDEIRKAWQTHFKA